MDDKENTSMSFDASGNNPDPMQFIKEESKIVEPAKEQSKPNWGNVSEKRKYIRAVGFEFEGNWVEFTAYSYGNGLEIEGLYSNIFFLSTSDLFSKIQLSDEKRDAFINKVKNFLSCN